MWDKFSVLMGYQIVYFLGYSWMLQQNLSRVKFSLVLDIEVGMLEMVLWIILRGYFVIRLQLVFLIQQVEKVKRDVLLQCEVRGVLWD